MAIKDYFKKDLSVVKLAVVEKISIAYIIFTSILLCIYGPTMDYFTQLVWFRVGVLSMICALYFLRKFFPCRATELLSHILVMLALIWWYQEIYYFSSQLPYQDHIFATIDWKLFDCQPALEFSKHVTSPFWSEAFYLGYYSYYFLMLITIFFYGIFRYNKLEKAEFIFFASFFMFYAIYEFLPVAGPDYYFHAIGLDAATSGVYPDVGYYFQSNHDMLEMPDTGIFSEIVQNTQRYGELPSAAFPSSHCGITVTLMILAWKAKNRWLFWLQMPLAILLSLATVYIRAHYLIDTIGGVIFAVIFYYLTAWMYDKLYKKTPL